jgi:class 3 adenylate cyclase/tetratricopeptide (TPR) repeat protein
MFTDLVASTRMRDRLGDDVADEIGADHDRIIGEALASTRGRLVKKLGDGSLAVFESSVDAVVAGQRIHEGVLLYNRHVADDRQINVRIGINAGEVAADNGDVIGLPVAVAARVCDKAEGGQILVTDTVRSLIGRRARFPFVSIGTHTLRGVDDGVELWSIADSPKSKGSRTSADIPFPAFLSRGIPASLVGRDEQMAQLDAAHAAASTTVQLAVVIGEPGIGKTSLTSTWCRTAADDRATVVAGRCTPDAKLPYQPFVEIARTVLGANPDLLLAVGPAAGNIAQLLPGIETPQGLPVPIKTDPDTTRYLIAEALASLLESRNGAPPTIVVLDDLHWADEHSIGVLAHLSRKDELSALLIGTYRDTDLVRSHPLPTLLSDLRREHRVIRIPLHRLSDHEVEEMISGHFGTAAAAEVVESIAAETQGNPFFVEEITTHLQDEGAIDADGRWISATPIEDYGIPEGVREVVGRRLDHLGADVISALEVAAVIGPSFSIDIAGTIADLDERAIDAVVDAAINARLINEGDSADEFAFAHALLRQTLYDDLPTRRRTRIHRAVGEALERRRAPAAALLNHWLNAERPDKALASALAAAAAAEKAFAASDMTANLELALELWDDVDDPVSIAETPHADLVIRLTWAQSDFGSAEHEAPIARISTELERADLDDRTRALLLVSLSRHLGLQGHTARARTTADRALRLVPKETPNEAYAEALAAVAGLRMLNAESSAAIMMAEDALDVAKASASERAELQALSSLASATGNLGQIEESTRHFDQLAERAHTLGFLRSQLIVFVNQGSTLHLNGYTTEALDLTERGIARTRELGVDRWEAMLHGNAADLLFDLGRWDEAHNHLVAVTPPPAVDHPQINISLMTLQLAAERGDDAATERELARLGHLTIEEMDSQFQGPYWASRVSDLRWHGALSDAYRLAVTALEMLGREEAWVQTTRLTAHAVEVVADAAEAGIADASWMAEAEAWQSRLSTETIAPQLTGGFGLTAAADLGRAHGKNDPELWRAAILVWDDTDNCYNGAKSRWRLAEAIREHNPTDPEISALLATAEEVALGLKAKPLLEAVRVVQARRP